jgi:hypothetical protein
MCIQSIKDRLKSRKEIRTGHGTAAILLLKMVTIHGQRERDQQGKSGESKLLTRRIQRERVRMELGQPETVSLWKPRNLLIPQNTLNSDFQNELLFPSR